MEGLEYLRSLSQEAKDKISAEFGGIENLYQTVFDINKTEYNLYANKPENYKSQLQLAENALNEIEERLEEIGLDGRDVTTEISNDFGEIIVSKNINALDIYLKQHGTDYLTMRDWIKKNYGI
ncbi:hypothetical protein [Salegentibacter flavus]|uniref:Uncharacterized protein n=1 Tax=Salegentibacter flavus TaxID=287099 RepID=A0A1I5DF78_9FLAO|nr:hypothetical protein [Salegentibacter flavus]SFN97796.1 hypothetical protein SAMN05660413_03308 [Salegentibacter flavus]